jgi:hypothetical protein
MTSYLRPDEEVTENEIRKSKERSNNVKSVLETAGSAATGIAGGQLAMKVLPFLNEYIPLEIAKKGIDKIVPKLGKFLDHGISQGLSLQSGLDYLKSEFLPEFGKEKKAENRQNEIGQVSQELQDFIEQQVQAGKSPDHAAATAMIRPEFLEITSQIEKQTGKPFPTSIRELYEGKAVNQGQSKATLQGQEEMGQQMQQSPQAPQGQQSQINPKLQAAYQKLGAYFGG